MFKYKRISGEKIFQFLIMFCIMGILLVPKKANTQISAETTKWKWDATAAYTIIHDDFCDWTTTGLPQYAISEANQRGLVLGFGAIVQSCIDNDDYNYWQIANAAVESGHEIINHSYTHPNKGLTGLSGASLQKETVDSKNKLEEMVPDNEVTFFIFPLDDYEDDIIQNLEQNGYVGSRSGPAPYDDRGVITQFNSYDPFRNTLFDAYHETQNDISIYNNCPQCLRDHADAAVSAGGWAIRELHGVADDSWGVCGLNNYTGHLDYVALLIDDGDLWMGTPSQVIKYIKTYNYCGDADVTNNVLSFSTPDDVPDGYDTEITVILTFDSDPGQIKLTQEGNVLEVENISTTEFFAQVNPTKGDVTIETGTETVFKSLNTFKKSNVYYNQGRINARLPVGAYNIGLFQMNGQKIGADISGYSNGEAINTPLNITDLANGFYLLAIQYNSGTISKKILLAK